MLCWKYPLYFFFFSPLDSCSHSYTAAFNMDAAAAGFIIKPEKKMSFLSVG